jgi:hypothetical protein
MQLKNPSKQKEKEKKPLFSNFWLLGTTYLKKTNTCIERNKIQV